MKVNFNNVRLSAIHSLNSLTKTLNTHIVNNDAVIDEVRCSVSDIERPLENLRNALITIACTYEEGNEDFRCVVDDDLKVEVFNPEDDGE